MPESERAVVPPAPVSRRNLELKAVDPAPGRSLATCGRLPAADGGLMVQRDTYFNVLDGSLKLREQTPGPTQLIQYIRSGGPSERESEYRIVRVADGEGCRAALSAALGIGAVVCKQRHLFLWKTVRIHLDDVDSLGSFIELEAAVAPGSDLGSERALLAQLRDALGITDECLLADGYARQLTVNPGAAAAVRRRLSLRAGG